MRQKLRKYFKEIVVLIILLVVASNALSYYRSLDLNSEKLLMKQVSLLDGSTYNIKQDRPVVIHFWATWCPICEFEAKNIQALTSKYEVITIAVQSGNQEDITAYMGEHNLNFKVVNDKDGILAREFNIKAFPTTFIYDSSQSLQFSEVGYTSTLGLYLRMLLTS